MVDEAYNQGMNAVELREVADNYFNKHPEHKDGVLKAYYAYHAPHFRLDPNAHNFTNSMRHSKCAWCGRSRTDVRWDDLPGKCLNRPDIEEIVDVIVKEEEKAIELRKRAKSIVPRIVLIHGMSGKTLAMLHHTHGLDPETVAGVLSYHEAIMTEYEDEMNRERERSLASEKVDEISCVVSQDSVKCQPD